MVLGYPLKVPLSCSKCAALLLRRAGLEEHLTSHGVVAFKYSSAKCGKKEYTRYHSCSCHYAKCNPKVIPMEPDLPFRCGVCRRQFASARGLGQHERHEHPAVWNERRQAGKTMTTRLPRGYWSEVELLILWEMEESFSSDPRLNQLIAENLPGKTTTQVADQRSNAKRQGPVGGGRRQLASVGSPRRTLGSENRPFGRGDRAGRPVPNPRSVAPQEEEVLVEPGIRQGEVGYHHVGWGNPPR